MSRIVEYTGVLAAGAAVGALYFGGLWWTVRRAVGSRRPGVLVLASYWLRTAAAMGLFYIIMEGDWLRLLVCLAGFLLVRQVLTWALGPGGCPVPVRPMEGGPS